MEKNIRDKKERLLKKEKLSFEKDILEVLAKYGYKTEIIQSANILIDIDDVPEIKIFYKELRK